MDLNADGLSDLLVGAPMATGNVREEGRVHVYINQGQVGRNTEHGIILLWCSDVLIVSAVDPNFTVPYIHV